MSRGSFDGIPGNSCCRVNANANSVWRLLDSRCLSNFLKCRIASPLKSKRTRPCTLNGLIPKTSSLCLKNCIMMRSFTRDARVRGVWLLNSSEYRVCR